MISRAQKLYDKYDGGDGLKEDALEQCVSETVACIGDEEGMDYRFADGSILFIGNDGTVVVADDVADPEPLDLDADDIDAWHDYTGGE